MNEEFNDELRRLRAKIKEIVDERISDSDIQKIERRMVEEPGFKFKINLFLHGFCPDYDAIFRKKDLKRDYKDCIIEFIFMKKYREAMEKSEAGRKLMALHEKLILHSLEVECESRLLGLMGGYCSVI